MARIIVDSRESRSGLTSLLSDLGADVVSEELECADYVLADGFGVERKAANDFVVSIMDRRLFSQAATMKEAYKRVVIIVEGSLQGVRSAIAPEALQGALSWLAILEGIHVVQTSNTRETAQMLLTMQRHAIEGLGYEIALRGGKPKDRSVMARYLVEGLPGVGPGAAAKLLAHFGSAHAVFSASSDQLRAVAGIGPKTVSSIRETLEFDTRLGQPTR